MLESWAFELGATRCQPEPEVEEKVVRCVFVKDLSGCPMQNERHAVWREGTKAEAVTVIQGVEGA